MYHESVLFFYCFFYWIFDCRRRDARTMMQVPSSLQLQEQTEQLSLGFSSQLGCSTYMYLNL